MPGLPKSKDTMRPREAYNLMVLDGIERTTTALRRGDPFSAQALTDMQSLQRRLSAFSEALDARVAELEVIEE